MSARWNVASFDEATVAYRSAQDDTPNQPIVTVSAPLRLCEAELVAALWRAMFGSDDDLSDDEVVRELVADQVVNAGMDTINEAAAEAGNLQPDSASYSVLIECREAVRRTFATVPTQRRALAGVS